MHPYDVIDVVVNDDNLPDEYEMTNVVPPYGREHDLHADCWCRPRVEGCMIYHRVYH